MIETLGNLRSVIIFFSASESEVYFDGRKERENLCHVKGIRH